MASVVTPGGTDLGPPGTARTDGGTVRSGAGGRPGSVALLLLLAVPVALVISFLWSFVMQTSGEMDELERVTGWSAVLRELPATVLVLAPLVVGLALGVRSARLGARRGTAAAVLHAVLLVLVLAAYVSVDVRGGTILVAVTVPALAALVYVAWHRPPAGPADRAAARRLRRAGLVAGAGIVAAFAWLLAAQMSLSNRAGDFSRTSVPQSGDVHAVTLAADRPGTYYIYVEGNAIASLGELAVQVTDPTGQTVPVEAVPSQPAYLRDFRGGHVVGTFVASRAGAYRVAATGTLPAVQARYAPANPYGDFAVGGKVTGWMRPHERGSAALLVASMAAAVVLAVAPGVRRRRRSA